MSPAQPRSPIYTPEQRRRRDASPWTLVQGILAPLQLLICLVSMGLIHHWFATGSGLAPATMSVVAKTLVLYAIMVTGAIWERDVFGRYLFARSFFWEDVVSMGVIALHTLFLVAWLADLMTASALMKLALIAYSAYLVNAVQFLFKLRVARQERTVSNTADSPMTTRPARSVP